LQRQSAPQAAGNSTRRPFGFSSALSLPFEAQPTRFSTDLTPTHTKEITTMFTDTLSNTAPLTSDFVAAGFAANTINLTEVRGTDIFDTPALAVTSAPWQTKARCADGNGTMSSLFFSDDHIDIARAKAICGNCQVADNCLAEAIERVEPWGVWGGQLLVNGEIAASRRPRGRPPKNARPELVVDELGYPVCA
jgi:WhiB family transcriptional regulator, redox-sensing transcriptional regulator